MVETDKKSCKPICLAIQTFMVETDKYRTEREKEREKERDIYSNKRASYNIICGG